MNTATTGCSRSQLNDPLETGGNGRIFRFTGSIYSNSYTVLGLILLAGVEKDLFCIYNDQKAAKTVSKIHQGIVIFISVWQNSTTKP